MVLVFVFFYSFFNNILYLSKKSHHITRVKTLQFACDEPL